MKGTNAAAYQLSRVTKPIVGDADPDVPYDTCKSCGQMDHLNRKGFCPDQACKKLRRQKAVVHNAGMYIDGTFYIIGDKIPDAGVAALPADKAVSNTARQEELTEIAGMTHRDLGELRRERKLTNHQISQIEANQVTEADVPTCKHDGCTTCPRPGDSLCVPHRLQANALEHKLKPARYRQSQSTDTELPSRRRRRGKQRMGNRIRGFERIK